MVQAETRYRLLRKIFNRKTKTKIEIERPEPEDACSEDEVEREKVRRLQLSLKAQRNMLIQLKKLEQNPQTRYDHIVTNGIFGLIFSLTVFAFVNLIHTLFLFESYKSEPLDVFASVICDKDWCTVRSYFDLEPPSIPWIMFSLTVGAPILYLSIRKFVSVDTPRMCIHVFSAFLFSVTWIVKRERHYASAREPL